MDTISVLKARIVIDGLAKANAELAAFDAEMHKVAGTSGSAGGNLDKVSVAARDVDRDLSKARATIAGADADLRRAGTSADASGSSLGKVSTVARDLDRDLARARVGVAAIGGSLQGFGADLRQAHDAIGDSRGGLQSLRSDLDRARDAAVTAGAGIKQGGTDGADGVRGLGDESRRTSHDVAGLSSGLDRAQQTIAAANAQLAKTGAVSSGVQADLRNLASRGVSGLDSDMSRLRSTLAKAEAELGKTGTLSRRTMRDLEDLGNGAGGAGGGLSGLSSALSGLPGGIGMLGASVAILVPLLFALGGSTFAVIAALGPLVGLAGAAAVGLVAAAQGFGVFRLATSGIAAALREQTTSQNAVGRSAITAGNQQRAAARQIQSAMDGVRTAHEQVISATQRLSDTERQAHTAQVALTQARIDARRALVDMHISLESAISSEAHAVLALKDAKAALAQTLAGTSPEDLAKAQQAVTDALHAQQQAVIDLAAAQAAYDATVASSTSTDAQKAQALLDLQKAQDNVANATFATRDAQTALTRAQAGPSDEDKTKALLAVRDAQDALTRSTLDRKRQQDDANIADRAGVNGSAQVVAALEAVRKTQQQASDAHRSLADAVRGVTRATQAVHDAQLNAASSAAGAALGAQRLNRAMDALPAPARAFVRELIALKPHLADLRATAAAGFFPGARAGLLAAATSFEAVRTVVSQTARVLGGLTQRAGELVGSAGFGHDIATIGGRNATIIGALGDAALHLVSALRHVIVAAGPLTSWLARSTDEWARNVDQAAAAGRENGKLAGFFDRTRRVLRLLGDILSNVGGGLLGLGKVGARSGNDILRSIDGAARRFNQWASSVGGRREIQRFFEDSRRLAGALLPVLGQVISTISTLSIRTMPLVTALRILGPLAGPLVTAFVAYKIALTALTGVLKAVEVAQFALNLVMDANPIALVVVAIAALVVGLVLAYKHVRWFHDAVDATFGWIKDHWPLLLGILTGPIGLAVGLIVQHWDDIKRATRIAVDWVSAKITAAWDSLTRATRTAWDAIKGAITTPVRAVATWLSDTAWPSIRSTATGVWRWLGGAAATAWDAIKTAVTTPIRAVATWLSDTAWPTITGAASKAWRAIKGAITGPIGDAISAVKSIIGHGGRDSSGLVGWLSDTWDNIVAGIAGPRGFASRVVGGITDAFKGAAKAVAKFLNLIIKAINLIPGIPNIKPIDTRGLAQGGSMSSAGVQHYATGGEVRRGTKIVKPMIMMGEEAPLHPEFVIPTNPAYRDRAHMLLGEAAKATGFLAGGVTGLAAGGIITASEFGGHNDPSAYLRTTASGLQANDLLWGFAELSSPPGSLNFSALGNLPMFTKLDFAYNGNVARDVPKVDVGKGGPGLTGHIRAADLAYAVGQALGLPGLANVSVSPSSGSGSGDGGVLGALGGALGGAVKGIAGIPAGLLSQGAGWILDQLPNPADMLPDWLVGTGKYVIDHVTGWIKDQVAGIIGLGGGGGTQGPAGLGTFDGLRVADWIIPELQYGRGHGWGGPITSGYRPGVDSHTGSGNSEHRGIQYPHGAVDFGGMVDAAGLANKLAFMRAVADYKGLRLLPAQGFRDDGHMSGTGHAIGGIISAAGTLGGLPFGGFFGGGGVVPGPLGAPVAIVAHGGERVTRAGKAMSTEDAVALIADALSQMDFYVGGERIDERIEVKLSDRDRRSGGTYFAGRHG